MKPIIEQQVGADFMLYNGEDDSVHILNPAARLIYDLHRQGAGEAETVAELRSRFEIPTGQDLASDIRAALAAMTARGLF